MCVGAVVTLPILRVVQYLETVRYAVAVSCLGCYDAPFLQDTTQPVHRVKPQGQVIEGFKKIQQRTIADAA